MKNYKNIWNITAKLPWCTLVTTGRVGSDFFQSLLDDHPEILLFNGVLRFHDFWENAQTTQNKNKLIAEDIVDE